MAIYLLRRLGLAVITLFLLSLIIFFAGQVLPGDPARSILGPLAAESAVRALDHQLGVDRPLLTQYWTWITGMLHGNMGESYQYQSSVEPLLRAALVNSPMEAPSWEPTKTLFEAVRDGTKLASAQYVSVAGS